MTVFVTGASGLVGSAVVRAAMRRGHRVVGAVGNYADKIEGLVEKRAVNLANEAATTGAVLDVYPDAIVNCAAVSVPEACDDDPARAQILNVTLPTWLARLAHHLDARLIHLSSEQVFNGAQANPYRVNDVPSPINLYGRQKLESEQMVQTLAAKRGVTVRAPLLMGNSPGGLRSAHEKLFADWTAGRAPRLFADEFRQTCTAENLAEVLLELCERRDLSGVFHWAGAELVSRHALGLKIRQHFKLNETQAPIVMARRSDVPEAVQKRQACLALDLAPLIGMLKTRAQTIDEQLAELQVPLPSRDWYLGLPAASLAGDSPRK